MRIGHWSQQEKAGSRVIGCGEEKIYDTYEYVTLKAEFYRMSTSH